MHALSVRGAASPGTGGRDVHARPPFSFTMNPRIRVVDLVKRFGAVTAVDHASFDVGEGELVSLLGPSGCGKTTTLRCIGGYETPTSGSIEIAGRTVNDVPIHKREIGMVFQNYALFPHKTVADNVGFALKMRGVSKARRREAVAEALALVDMEGLEGRFPSQLSGGQSQRVALARAIIHRPAVLLLDEPLANLDRKLRETMRVELKLIQEKVGISAVLVTHDQEEALVMSDRIAVMEGGRIHQLGSPGEIYNRPSTAFVANFIGETNFMQGTIVALDDGIAGVRIEGDLCITANAVDGCRVGTDVGVSVRPERIRIGPAAPGDAANVVAGTVEFVTYLGAVASYRVRAKGGLRLQVMKPIAGEEAVLAEGQEVAIWWTPEQGRILA